MQPRILLKPGREKPIRNYHPWIFSGAVNRVAGDPQPGETISIYDFQNNPIGKAAYSPKSQIRARMWSWDFEDTIDQGFFEIRIKNAINKRARLINNGLIASNAVRLIFAESDLLPGLIVDRYADVLVVQILTTGSEYWRDTILDILEHETSIKTIFERSDLDVRDLEGLPQKSGWARGQKDTGFLEIFENQLKFLVDFHFGQKTGFYLDQRENRKKILPYIAGKDVLNCFSYTGGFTVYGLFGGARSVVSIESSKEANQLAKKNVAINNLDSSACEWIEGDVFAELRLLRDKNQKFDIIILDPPKFAPTSAQRYRAARGYKDINLLAIKLLKPGGVLMTFSCSGGIGVDLFQKIIADAALDANRNMQIIEKLHQAHDHPILLSFPEGEYLKGFICQMMD